MASARDSFPAPKFILFAANWIAKGEKWTVPVGGGVAKVVRLGTQPIKLAVDVYYSPLRPKADNDQWQAQFTVTFLFPR